MLVATPGSFRHKDAMQAGAARGFASVRGKIALPIINRFWVI
jgi:hypothetical protein